VRAEEGCIEYGLVVDVDGFGPNQAPLGPDTFAFVEKWKDEEALKLHFTLPHMTDYREKSKDLIADRKVHVLKSADLPRRPRARGAAQYSPGKSAGQVCCGSNEDAWPICFNHVMKVFSAGLVSALLR
jgi:quinol monooxygenase YgiN